jgi:hypothetical protein
MLYKTKRIPLVFLFLSGFLLTLGGFGLNIKGFAYRAIALARIES